MKKIKEIIRNDLAIVKKEYKKVLVETSPNLKKARYQYQTYHATDFFFSNLETKDNQKELSIEIKRELKFYYEKYKLTKKDSCLVVGLGNQNISCDSLGVKTTEQILATGYLDTLKIPTTYRKVYTIIPKTMKQSGVFPFTIVEAVKEQIKPSFIIVIDTLICNKIDYLNKMVQISDSGITPGSGLANYGIELSKNTLGIPVIVIGAPLAIETNTLIKNIGKAKKSNYDFIVTKKDIDYDVELLSNIIAKSINESLNHLKNL